MRLAPLAAALALVASGCVAGTLPGGVHEPPPFVHEFAFTFDVRVTEAFAARTAPVSLPDNGSCVTVNANDTRILGGHARATWTPNAPSTRTLALGAVTPRNVSGQRVVNGTSPLDLDLNATRVTSADPLVVYLGVASGTGAAVQQDARIALNFSYVGPAPEVVNASCKIAVGN